MRMWRTGTSQVVHSPLPSRSLVLPVCYPRNLQKDLQAQCESASLQQWQCWSSQLVHISKADHDEGSCNCTLSPPSKVFTCSYLSTAHTRAELGCEKGKSSFKKEYQPMPGGKIKGKQKKKAVSELQMDWFWQCGMFWKDICEKGRIAVVLQLSSCRLIQHFVLFQFFYNLLLQFF